MEIQFGESKAGFGPGVVVSLDGDEVATAIHDYLAAKGVRIHGASTTKVNGALCEDGRVFVDPSGDVLANGYRFTGRGYVMR